MKKPIPLSGNFNLKDHVTILTGRDHHVSGWIRGKLYASPPRYDVQTDKKLIQGLLPCEITLDVLHIEPITKG